MHNSEIPIKKKIVNVKPSNLRRSPAADLPAYRSNVCRFDGVQWLAGSSRALVISPRTWIGQTSDVHIHVWAAVLLAALSVFSRSCWRSCVPGTSPRVLRSRRADADVEPFDPSGGRAYRNAFSVFGSLAFLSFYRDWRVLIPATVVVALDHMFFANVYPQSVFGILTQENWRWVENTPRGSFLKILF